MYGIEHLTGFAPVEARGRNEVTGLVVARGSERQTLPADTVVMSGGTVAQWGLLVQAGGTRALRPRPPRLRARAGARRRARRRRGGRHRAGRPSQGGGRQRHAVRLLLRGRHDQGRAPVGVGGLRLARALEALHDRDDGAVPGEDVPPQLGPPHGPRARRRPRRGARRRHHRPPAPQPHELLAPGRARLRAREAHRDPPLARRAWRQDAVGRRLEAALRLRRRRGRDRRGPRVARPDRRLDARQADRARPRGGGVPRADLPQPLRRHEARPRPLRDRVRRRRVDPRRRHRGPPVRDRVLRHHDVVGRRRHGAVVHVVERRVGDGLPDRERDVGDRRGEPGGAERPDGAREADRTSTSRTRPSRISARATPTSRACPA